MPVKTTNHPINLMLQLKYLYFALPDGSGSVKRSCLHFTYNVKPSEFSKEYTVKIEYKISKRPKVTVLRPKLKIPKSKMKIHMFKDNSLCLYYHKFKEWNNTMLLSKNIVPWVSEWLLHYEIWSVTGFWCGGGIHPN